MSSFERDGKGLSDAHETVPKPRIQTLSDMIFGLALSIGAATLLTQKPGSETDVAYSLLSFGFAFFILGLVWLRYSRITSVLPVESTGIVAANMLLLFFVSVEPYLFNLMTISGYAPSLGQLDSASTTTLYAFDLGALQLVLAYFIHELTVEDRRLIPRELLRGYRLQMNATIIVAAIFLLSSLPMFWSVVIIQSPTVPLRYVMWGGILFVNAGRRLDERLRGAKSRPS